MDFEWKVTIGNLLTITSFFAVLVSLLYSLHSKAIKKLADIDSELKDIKYRLRLVWGWFKKEHSIDEAELDDEISRIERDRNKRR